MPGRRYSESLSAALQESAYEMAVCRCCSTGRIPNTAPSRETGKSVRNTQRYQKNARDSCGVLAGTRPVPPLGLRIPPLHLAQSTPQVHGVEPEEFADVVERKDPLLSFVHNPFFGFAEQFSGGGISRAAVFLLVVKRVFENGRDQRFFWFVIFAAPKCVQILL